MVKFIANKAEWDQTMKDAGDKFVIVDFTASWCGPCKMIGPKFEALEQQFPDVVFRKVDVDDCDEVAADEGVSAMPTFKVYKNGVKTDEMVGASEAKLLEMLQKCK